MDPLTKFRSDRARIAVVGSAFRMPGVGSEGFWEALVAGQDLVSTVPPDRWAQDSYLHPRKSEPGSSYTFAAGSLGDVAGFDAAFFGISPREAEQMDPQQRLLLEASWEAFESAGIPPSTLRGHRCGVYVGMSSIDYAYRRADDLGSIDATTMTGSTGSIAANRISYVFDLRGPSMVIDTACSSSLVALHQACQSIRHGECDAALVGGISLHLHPYGFVGFSKASMLSPHGRCRVFDERGDGYVRSEGGAVLLLKPLAQAIADGNSILGVIVETGVNNDGRKTGLTVPSHVGQAQLLREVYERAGIDPSEIDYFEAHGTGTAVGDPIETRAIGEAIGQQRPRHQPLPIGSVKSHVGHLEAASGMAGLVKALYVLRHRYVPANLHLDHPNPHIDLAGWNLAPVTQPLSLDAGRRVVVGVSSFGFGGTNAHAVLTSFESPGSRSHSRPVSASASAPLMLSARSPEALKAGARRMARFLRERADLSDYDVAYSARFARDVHAYRLLVNGESRAAVASALDQFAAEGTASGVVTGQFRRDASAPAFVFSGNGSQWVGMGLQLLDEEPLFRETLEEIDARFAAHADRSIIAELRAAPVAGGLERTEVAQPALFAVQVGLTRLFECQGVRPVAVCGHSVGEVAAAWASGALTLDAAIRVIYERSAHQGPTRGRGCMAVVELGEADVGALLKRLGLHDLIIVAAINTAHNVTVAGDDSAMTQLGALLARRRINFRRLALDYAFHSSAMDGIREGLVQSLRGLTTEPSTLPLYSTVTGAVIDGAALGAEYWWDNVRRPVRFHAAIRAMIGAGINTFVEIGPRPVLISYLSEIAKSAEVRAFAIPALTGNDSGGRRVRAVVDQLELSGALHRPARLFPVPGQIVDLPRYAWQHERYWHPSTSESLGLLARHTVHPLLGYALPGEPLHWENHLDTTKLPALADHAVGGSVVFPAAGFVEMALAAGAHRRPGSSVAAIEDLEILSPLLLEKEHSKVVRLRIDPQDGNFTIVSRDRTRDDRWRTHAVGRLVEDGVPAAVPPFSMPEGSPDVTAAAHYALAESLGLQYGPAFQVVQSAWLCEGKLMGALAWPESIGAPDPAILLHPCYLDGAFQLLFDLALHEHRALGAQRGDLQTFLPVRIQRLDLAQRGGQAAGALVEPAGSRHRSRRALQADFTLYDGSGAPVAVARGVRFRATQLQRDAGDTPSRILTRLIPMPRRHGDGALTLPSSGEAARLCTRQLHSPARATSRRRFADEVEPLLDVLCAAFAERALRTLAGESRTFSPEQLTTERGLSADAVPLVRHLLEVLTEEGVVQAMDGQWQWTGADRFPDPTDIWASLIDDYPEYCAIIARTGTAGVRLCERLHLGAQGEPKERHLSESTFSWVDGCTREEAAAVFHAVGEVLREAAASQPATARLRVLHIVGSVSREEVACASVPILPGDVCDTVIAARKREAIDEVRLRHSAAARLPCEVIELDQEGFEPPDALGGPFDVVVLSEGLADAPDPAVRLDNIRRLLFDDGILLTIEQHPSRAEDLAFGLHPKWWRAEEAGADRLAHATRHAPRAWGPSLARSGFLEVETVCDAPGATSGPYVLIARADRPAREDRASPVVVGRTWLLVRDPQGYSATLGTALAKELRQNGQRVIVVTTQREYAAHDSDHVALDTGSREHWSRLIGELQHAGTKPEAWVHLAGLDLATGAAPLEARLAAQEARAGVLIAWMKACALEEGLQADCWVIGAQAGLSLLSHPAAPPGRLRDGDAASHSEPQLPPDRLRDAALWGLTRVAAQEFADLRVRWVDLADPLPHLPNAAQLREEMLHPDAEDEVLLTSEGRFVPRMRIEHRSAESAAAPGGTGTEQASASGASARIQLDFAIPGPFRNLRWRGDPPPNEPLRPGEVEVDVRAAGLNFRDVMYAMGLLPDEAIEDGFCGPSLGMELAGVVHSVGSGVDLVPGDEVIAIAPASFANRARTQAFAVTRKPTGWSFTSAATVPTAFFTAYYSLVELAHLQAGERVLIHGAAGGVGIAAIQIASHLGAEIFATAGTTEKRDLVEMLGADRVFDSRSLTFADEVLHATGGAGIDVVLNSLAGEAMRRNLRVLRPFGRMIELGKRDFYENSRLGLRPFRNNIAYFGVDADQLIAHRPETARRVLEELMKWFAAGILHPLPHRAFCASDIEAAFRHMQASRHVGKIVVTFPENFESIVGSQPVPVAPVRLRSDGTYLVTGGLSGFGLRTAQWLVSRGARYLALVSRTGAPAPEAHQALEQLVSAGVTVRAIACDVARGPALEAALQELDATMPPLRGIVHAAMVIEDALIRDMDRGQLHRVLAPKIGGALNLHELTRHRELDFFLLYSSATTLFGNPGQGAYVAANTAVEALAAERRALGLPVTCVSWGPIGDAGYLARNERVREALVGRIGGRALTADEALRSLDELLAGSARTVGLLELDWNVLGRFLPAARAPKFSELARESARSAGGQESAHDLRRRLAELAEGELLPALTEVVRGEIAQILRIAPERIDARASLFDIGMDSLMAVELASSLEGSLGIQLSALSLSDAPTVERIAARLADQLRPAAEEPSAGVAATSDTSDQVRLLAARHAAEVSEQAAAEFSAELDGGARGVATPVSLTAGGNS